MKNKKPRLGFQRSSALVSAPVSAGTLIASFLAAVWGQYTLALVLMFFFLLAFAARAWATAAATRLSITVSSTSMGLFPDEEIDLQVTVKNNKALPVLWMELFFPLSQRLCLVPKTCREPDDWEKEALQNGGFSPQLVGEKKISLLLWHETLRFTLRWFARCRGVYSMDCWRLRTGDGFGLMQVEHPLPQESIRCFVVYPRLIQVKPDLFLRSLWNSDTGSRGVMEDPTVIRSTRDYQSSDSLKHINWRLAARALPLSVNVYEDILPQSIHFIFDGESFSGPDPHLQEMEDALSILASEVMLLTDRQMQCGLSICQGNNCEAINIFSSKNPEELLTTLALYQPLSPKRDYEDGPVLVQKTVFDEAPVLEAAQKIGRFYYVAYQTPSSQNAELLLQFGFSQVSILTYADPLPFGEFEVVSLTGLKEVISHE